jgi:hypothetical protein
VPGWYWLVAYLLGTLCFTHYVHGVHESIRLTLGLMGLDELHLRVLATSSEDLTEKENAKKGETYLHTSAYGN